MRRTDAAGLEFAPDEVASASLDNALWWILETAGFMKERGIDLADWISYVGDRHALGWEEMRGKDLHDFARQVCLEIVSCGGRIDSMREDEGKAEIVSVWPAEEDLADAHLTRDEFAPIHGIFEPIARYLGWRYSFEVLEGRWVLRFEGS